MKIEKHEFNFFPQSKLDYQEIVKNLKDNGYDKRLPIYIFENKVLDGWTRYTACLELGINPVIEQFIGSRMDALNFSTRVNKDRRHLDSGQKACIAVDNAHFFEQIQNEVEKERKEKISEIKKESQRDEKGKFSKSEKKFSSVDTQKTRTATKIAEQFGTNQSYINQAKKLKEEKPDQFKAVLNGEKTFQEVKKEVKQAKLEEKKQENLEKLKSEIKQDYTPTVHHMDCLDFLNTLSDDSINVLITDPPYSTDVKDIKSFAESWLPLALKKLKQTGRAYICIGAYPKEIKAYLDVLLSQNKFIVDNPLIWTYRNTFLLTQ